MTKTAQKLPATFEAALAELEELTEQMAQGDIPLQALMASYERGVALQKFCESQLQAAQQQLQVLEKGELKALEKNLLDD